MEAPETRYARSGDVSIAYQVSGDGPIDLVFAPGTVSHLDLDVDWSSPEDEWLMERFHSFCRLIRFDKRGTGLSDRVSGAATLEERTDDIRAVMDAVGIHRAVILGASEGGSMACLFAATYPDRTQALIVWAGQVRWVREPDMPWGIRREEYEKVIEDLATRGVTESYVRGWGAGYGADAPAELVQREMRLARASASPASIAALERMNMEIDLRGILPSIQAATLIINASNDPISPIEGARYLADRIPGARFFAYPGKTHVPTTRAEWTLVLDELQEFVTGTRPAPATERVLTTVLLTDIVGSTEKAAELGDAGWKEVLDLHNALVRREIGRFGGTEIDTAGDGFFVTFDGPARAVRCARAIAQAVCQLKLEIRAGCHTGEVELAGDTVRGIAVHIGARVAAEARPSEVLVSSTVKDLVAGSGLMFEDAGEHQLRGVPGAWRLYRVSADDTQLNASVRPATDGSDVSQEARSPFEVLPGVDRCARPTSSVHARLRAASCRVGW